MERDAEQLVLLGAGGLLPLLLLFVTTVLL